MAVALNSHRHSCGIQNYLSECIFTDYLNVIELVRLHVFDVKPKNIRNSPGLRILFVSHVLKPCMSSVILLRMIALTFQVVHHSHHVPSILLV